MFNSFSTVLFQVGKVSPRVQPQQNWADHRSQSSEDVFQEELPGADQPKNAVFHSRGSSPINAKKFIVENGFRRNDPKRHSSPRISMRSENRMRLSPPKPPVRRTQTPNNPPIQNGTPTRRMFWSPERQQNNKMLVTRKNSAPASDENSQYL